MLYDNDDDDNDDDDDGFDDIDEWLCFFYCVYFLKIVSEIAFHEVARKFNIFIYI